MAEVFPEGAQIEARGEPKWKTEKARPGKEWPGKAWPGKVGAFWEESPGGHSRMPFVLAG